MNGSGCKNCPVKPCHTLHYRGSYCAEQRAQHGLGDPLTNADRIRAMSGEEMAKEFALITGWDRSEYEKAKRIGVEKVMLDWLKQKVEE